MIMDIEKEDSTLLKLLSTMNRCKEVFDCNELTTIEDILNKAMDEIQTLRAKVASADVLVEALRIVINEAEEIELHDTNYVAVPFEIFYKMEDQYEALATYDKLSEVKHDTK